MGREDILYLQTVSLRLLGSRFHFRANAGYMTYLTPSLFNRVILRPFQIIPLTMAPKKRSKVDLSHLRALIQLKKETAPLMNEDVKALLIPSSYKSYEYTMALWEK
jgi:hypothetical protein